MTNGHLDIIKRASEVFDELIVSVLNNKSKTPLFSVSERVKILEEATKDMPHFHIGSAIPCLICGERFISDSERMYCDDCDEGYDDYDLKGRLI